MTDNPQLERFFKAGVGLLAWVALLWIIQRAASHVMEIIILLGVALVMTYVLLAPVNAVEWGLKWVFKWAGTLKGIQWLTHVLNNASRIMAILLVYMVFILTMFFVGLRFVPIAVHQLYQFSSQVPTYLSDVEEWVLNLPFARGYFHHQIMTLRSQGDISGPQEQNIQAENAKHPAETTKSPLTHTEKEVIRQKVFATSDNVNHFVKTHLAATFTNIFLVLSTTLAGFVFLLTTFVLTFYFLLDGQRLKNGFLNMLPHAAQEPIEFIFSNMHNVMFGFIKGQLILGIATGIYMIIIYSVFGVPYAFFLGGFFAISELLPVIGTWLGFSPGFLVLLFINPLKLLFVIGCIYIFQTIKDNLVAPRVVGHVLGLHPVIVIIALITCAKLGGLMGVLFALPLASFFNILIRLTQHERELTPAKKRIPAKGTPKTSEA